jgi:spore germination cell wall hydrolase CwlJ-like protein
MARLALNFGIHSVLFLFTALAFLPAAYAQFPAIRSCHNSGNTNQCMVCNCFHEAQGEEYAGQVMVSRVVLARTTSNVENWPNTPCAVVYQGAQFSWTLSRSKKNQGVPANHSCNRAVAEARTTPGPKPLYYHATNIRPRDWNFSLLRPMKVIDKHKFYFHKEQVGGSWLFNDETNEIISRGQRRQRRSR